MEISANKSSGIYYPVLASCLLALMGFFFWTIGVQNDIESDNNLFVLLFAVQMLPLLICLVRRSPDYLVFIFSMYAITYTSTRLMELSKFDVLPASARAELLQMIICNLLTMVTYYSVRYFAIDEPDLRKSMPLMDCSQRQIVGFVILFILATTLSSVGSLTIRRPMDGLSAVFTLLIITSVSTESPRLALAAKAIVVFVVIVMVLAVGMLGKAIALVLLVLPLLIITRRWRMLILLLPLTFAGAAFQSVKSVYRAFTWQEDEVTMEERIVVARDLLTGLFFPEAEIRSDIAVALEEMKYAAMLKKRMEEGNFDRDLNAIEAEVNSGTPLDFLMGGANRIADSSLERVLEMTPKEVPFWGGESYMNGLYTFIPRVIWPDKPVWELGGKFGSVYGYLGDEDTITSIAYSYLAEGYMNFGYTGLYVSAMLVGLIFSLVEAATLRASRPGCKLPAYIFFIPAFTIYQVELVTMLQSLFFDGVLLIIVCFILIPSKTKEIAQA